MHTGHDHGTRARYQSGCRCGDCKHRNTLYQREYRTRTRPRGDRVTTAGGVVYDQLTLT